VRRRFAALVVSLAVSLWLPGPLLGAEIALRDGSKVEGTIHGLIVSREVWVETIFWLLEGTRKFEFLFYILVNGTDITAIDQAGVQTRVDSPRMIAVGHFREDERRPSDADALVRLLERWRHWEGLRVDGERPVLLAKDVNAGMRVPLSGTSFSDFYPLAMLSAFVPDALTADQRLKPLAEQARRTLPRKGNPTRHDVALLGEFRFSDGAGRLVRELSTWKVTVKAASRSARRELDRAGRPGYALAVILDLQYLGPEGEVRAPRTWLLARGGLVLPSGGIGITLGRPLREVEVDMLRWLHSRDTRALRSGAAFAEIAIGFFVPESLTPDQLWLAFADVPPLRLPPVAVLP
jgi:hypothetical protein